METPSPTKVVSSGGFEIGLTMILYCGLTCVPFQLTIHDFSSLTSFQSLMHLT